MVDFLNPNSQKQTTILNYIQVISSRIKNPNSQNNTSIFNYIQVISSRIKNPDSQNTKTHSISHP